MYGSYVYVFFDGLDNVLHYMSVRRHNLIEVTEGGVHL